MLKLPRVLSVVKNLIMLLNSYAVLSSCVILCTEGASHGLPGGDACTKGIHESTELTASFAFMMPVATPPNTIAFGSGYIQVKDMAMAGIFLNIASQIVVVLAIVYLLPLVWGVDLTAVP